MALHPGQQKRHFPEELPVVEDPIRRALEENEDWYRDLVEHSQDLLCVHDLEGRFLSINPTPARLLGYSVEEVVQKPMRDFVDPQFRAQFDAYLREIARAGQADGLLALLTRSGERRIWEYHNTLRTEGVETPIVRGIAHDVTERVRAEKALRAANEQLLKTAQERERVLHELTLFRTLLDQSNDFIQVIEPETGRFLDVNQRACAELGYSREELLSMTVFEIEPGGDDSFGERLEQQLRETGFAVFERTRRRKDGTIFPVEVNLRRVRLNREYDVAVSRDITARKQGQKALRESEERFRAVYARSPIGIALVESRTGRILQVNPKYCEITGRGEEELVGMDVRTITHPDDVGNTSENLRQLANEQRPNYEMDKRYVRPDGSVRWVRVQVVPMWGQGETDRWHMGLVQDITERKKSEEAIVALVQEVCEAKKKLTEEKLYLEQEIDTELGFGEIVGKSKALQTVMEQVGKVADSNATVLLLGETGTGKELVARAIHRLSLRSGSSFIKMNCAAIPSGLLESELFGHEKGAFTGAVARRLDDLSWPTRARCFWTRSARFRWRCSRSCCGYCRIGSSSGWAESTR